jgi:DNA-binding NarL/FixJ family response regulator
MDVRMPRVDGIEATRADPCASPTQRADPSPKIIVLTTFDDDEYALHALRAGASGFLLKDTLPEVLLDSIRTVVDGEPSSPPRRPDACSTTNCCPASAPADQPAVPGKGTTPRPTRTRRTAETGDSADRTQRPVRRRSLLDEAAARRLETLTPRETEVLVLIAQGLSNTEIGQRLFLAQPTVKTHVGRILMKLEARDRVQAVVLAYEAGLVGTARSLNARTLCRNPEIILRYDCQARGRGRLGEDHPLVRCGQTPVRRRSWSHELISDTHRCSSVSDHPERPTPAIQAIGLRKTYGDR